LVDLGYKNCLDDPSDLISSCHPRLRGGVRQLVATDSAFAAIKDDASVVTWGAKRAIHGCAELMDVQQVVPNEGAFAAIKSDGSVVTWGDPACGGDSSEVAWV